GQALDWLVYHSIPSAHMTRSSVEQYPKSAAHRGGVEIRVRNGECQLPWLGGQSDTFFEGSSLSALLQSDRCPVHRVHRNGKKGLPRPMVRERDHTRLRAAPGLVGHRSTIAGDVRVDTRALDTRIAILWMIPHAEQPSGRGNPMNVSLAPELEQ